LIVMLTHHDQTVPQAAALFDLLQALPVQHWGFKDVGLPPDQMTALVRQMKAAGKTTYLEVVSLSEAEGLAGARLAVEAGFDILMGTVYYPSIGAYLRDKPVRYYPFPGRVHGHPSLLDGTPDEIVQHACQLEASGAAGLDLLTYRYTGDAPALLRAVTQAVRIPVVSAGSIDSLARIDEVQAAGAQAFTIGSAFFERRFAPEGTIADNVLVVCRHLQASA
jgi:hypothetical protein